MAFTQINITQDNALKKIKVLGNINNIDVSNISKQVDFAIKLAYDLTNSLDEESLLKLTNLKKSI
jgi:hypothetical protein